MNGTTNGKTDALAKGGYDNIRALLESRKSAIAEVLPKHLTAQRLLKVMLNCVHKTPALQKCTPSSLLHCMITSAELGLEPGGALGHAYLVPFGNICTLIIGYRGLIELARRTGSLVQVEAHVVHEHDAFDVCFGLAPKLLHSPKLDGDPGKPRAVYMLARTRDGATHVEVMTWAEVQRIKSRSRSASNGPWVTDEEEMGKKTVVRRGMKYLPMSAEFARAIEHDDEDFVDGEVVRPALNAENGLAQQIAAPTSKPSVAERAKEAIRAKHPPIVDVKEGETEEEAAARVSEPPDDVPLPGEADYPGPPEAQS
jgi:recombination protein RecT